MGQKVNPHGARVGVIFDWSTKWYAGKKDFSNYIKEDYEIRKSIKGREDLKDAGISRIDIQRTSDKVRITVYTAKPGIMIGKDGATVELLKKQLEAMTGKTIALDILEIRNPDIEAQLVAENIAQQLEKRIAFRRAMKKSLQSAMRAGAKGVKTLASGRLGGADIARSEGYHEGSIPLQTLRAKIDYGFAEAKTTYGRVGIKVWIYKGQHITKGHTLVNPTEAGAPGSRRERPDRRGGRFNRGERRDNRRPEGGR